MERFDLAVIGGGPGGYHGAELAAKAGLRVVLAAEGPLGGVCLNEGCVPTKALLASAKRLLAVKEGARFGVTAEGISLDHAKAMARKNKTVKILTRGVEQTLKQAGVMILSGRGRILGREEGDFLLSVGDEKLRAGRILLAAGAAPAVPPIKGLREGMERGFVLTSGGLLSAEQVPERLAVIGGGVIGVEMAFYFAAAGSRVSILETADHIGGPIDRVLSGKLAASLKKKGVEVRCGCRVTEVGESSVWIGGADGAKEEIPASLVLLSTGRRPASGDLGLEAIGLTPEPSGAVLTDEHGETGVPGVFAAGDLNGKMMLAHTAYREAEAAVGKMTGHPCPVDYRLIPSALYTSPEIAMVGETEDAVRARGEDPLVLRLPMRLSGRYLAEEEGGDGEVCLVAERGTKRLLGVHLMGPYASEMIAAAALILGAPLNEEAVRRIVFPHPTVSEVLREGLFELYAEK